MTDFYAKTNVIDDLSQAYEFATVAEFKASLIEFPDGKVINLLDRGAEFIKITGTGTANTFNIIASTSIDQSIVYTPKKNTINARAWGLFGGVDETVGLQAFYQSVVDNDYEGILAPVDYISSGELLNESGNKNFNIHSPVGRAKITFTAVIDRAVRMGDAKSFKHHNVDYDLDGNVAACLFIRGTSPDLGNVEIDNCAITAVAQTTQAADAIAIDVGGARENIDITRVTIDGVERTDTARFCNGIFVHGVTGIVNINRCSISDVVCPTDFFDADAISVFGAQNGNDGALDTGKVTIDNNDLKDCRGRFIKSQHTETTVSNNRGVISPNMRLIKNWRFADFQMSNGKMTDNTLDYGTAVLADDLTGVSTAYARFANKKNITRKSSICSGNTLITKTTWAQVILSEMEFGQNSVIVDNNDFGASNVTVLHAGDEEDFVEGYYNINNNTLEVGVQLFDVTSEQTWINMFVGITGNKNIDTATGHFRQAFPLGGTFSLESNFVLGRNSRIIERVEWVFIFTRLTNGNAFMFGSQLNGSRPFTGQGHVVVSGLQMEVAPADALERWQRVINDPELSSWSTWRQTSYT